MNLGPVLAALWSRLPPLVNLVLAAWLGYALTRAVAMAMYPIPPVEVTVTLPTVATAAHAPASRIDWNGVVRAHLFGQPGSSKPPPTAVASAPQTRLKLTLLGTLYSDHAENAQAVISDASGKVKKYSIGEAVLGGAQLAEVHRDKAILLRDGQYETLPMKRDGLTKESSVAFSEDPTPDNLARSAALVATREQILARPTTMTDYIRFYPHRQNDRFLGYRVKPGRKKPELFQQLGLQANDVITAINGVVLNDALKGLSAMEQLATASQVDLQLLRQGRTEFLSIPLSH